MIPVVRCTPNVTINPHPGGLMIIAALVHAARYLGRDLWVTSGSDGQHSGPEDPHPLGKAFDVRSHDTTEKKLTLDTIMNFLGDVKFYGFIEDEGLPNEHFHIQVQKGIIYP